MKRYLIQTVIVSPLSDQSPVIITLPSNAIPIGIEIRPTSMPEGLFLHYLVLCDENGDPIEEVVTPNIYEMAWNELYKLFGERLEQDNLDAMDAVLKGVKVEIVDEQERQIG